MLIWCFAGGDSQVWARDSRLLSRTVISSASERTEPPVASRIPASSAVGDSRTVQAAATYQSRHVSRGMSATAGSGGISAAAGSSLPLPCPCHARAPSARGPQPPAPSAQPSPSCPHWQQQASSIHNHPKTLHTSSVEKVAVLELALHPRPVASRRRQHQRPTEQRRLRR